MRVLLIAESANPEWVSVPLEGWAHSRALSRRVEAHVVTQVRNREAFLRAGVDEDAFTSIDNEYIAKPLWRIGSLLRGGSNKGWTTLMAFKSLEYRSFERLAWRRFGAEIHAGRYDVVHRLTPLSPTIPSRLATWCKRARVPFVIGPLNGGVPWPKGFDGARRREREWLSYVRSAHRLMPGYRSTRRDAAALVIGSRDTWHQMPERYRERCVYVPENAIDPKLFDLSTPLPARAPGPLRIAFLGRLVPYKGADMLLHATAGLVRAGKASVDLIGDGPERQNLERIVADEGLGGGVTFAGWLAHDQVAARLRNADVFGFPSVREFGGAVVLEAMALGVVPVVLDYGGPGELVSPATGFAIPMANRTELVARLRSIMEDLACNIDRLAALRAAGRDRVRRHFTWDAKAGQIIQIYEWVLGRSPKPDFGMPLPDVGQAVASDRN